MVSLVGSVNISLGYSGLLIPLGGELIDASFPPINVEFHLFYLDCCLEVLIDI